MVIKYLYNSFNLANSISGSAAAHVRELNRTIEEMPNYDPEVKVQRIELVWQQNRWYMIGLYEGSTKILYQTLNKVLEEDKKRITGLIADITHTNKEDKKDV